MGNSNGVPSNIQRNTFIMSETAFTIIMVIIAILVIVIAALILQYFVKKKEIKKLLETKQDTFSKEEQDIIYEYRILNPQDKSIIKNTISSKIQEYRHPKE